jgi:hypothetical protein
MNAESCLPGPDLNAGFGDTWIAYVHPDDQMKILDTLSRALKPDSRFHRSIAFVGAMESTVGCFRKRDFAGTT